MTKRFENAFRATNRSFEFALQRVERDPFFRVAPPGCPIGDDVQRRVFESDFTGKHRLWHQGHSNELGTIPRQPLDFRCGFQPWPLRTGIDGAIDNRLLTFGCRL